MSQQNVTVSGTNLITLHYRNRKKTCQEIVYVQCLAMASTASVASPRLVHNLTDFEKLFSKQETTIIII